MQHSRVLQTGLWCLLSEASLSSLALEMDIEEFSLDSVIRGHHIYKSIWTPVSGEILAVTAEEGNSEDQYAVGVYKGATLVGHAPRELSRTFYFFLRRGGSIECTVTGHRKLGVGLEVPCTYSMSGKGRYIKRLVKLLCKPKKEQD